MALCLPFTYGGCGGGGSNGDGGSSNGGGSSSSGDGESNDAGDNVGSNFDGLKIFVTAARHVGDFANDPTLSGTTGIEKADDFCMQDANLPAGDSIYKALLVDGINRDAVTLTDWVLQPNTTYYRPSGVEIDTTGDDAILLAYWRDMKNSIAQNTGQGYTSTWTGIADAGDFSTNANRNCLGWTSSGMGLGGFGTYNAKDRAAFDWYGGSAACRLYERLYCVEQL